MHHLDKDVAFGFPVVLMHIVVPAIFVGTFLAFCVFRSDVLDEALE
jgi:hypothetical protein